MSAIEAHVTATDRAFHVEGYEKIEYDLLYVDGVFPWTSRNWQTAIVGTGAA